MLVLRIGRGSARPPVSEPQAIEDLFFRLKPCLVWCNRRVPMSDTRQTRAIAPPSARRCAVGRRPELKECPRFRPGEDKGDTASPSTAQTLESLLTSS